jgi:hypothetical protein
MVICGLPGEYILLGLRGNFFGRLLNINHTLLHKTVIIYPWDSYIFKILSISIDSLLQAASGNFLLLLHKTDYLPRVGPPEQKIKGFLTLKGDRI